MSGARPEPAHRWAPLAAVALVAATLAACGGSGSDSAPQPAPEAAADPERLAEDRDLPGPLAANLERANELEDGGREALEARLAELEGYPVVVNQWGSWCPPCRAEFPFFADSARAHLEDVAFIGVDIMDERGAAEDFLAEFPTPFPHVFDPDAEGVSELGWPGSSPTTWLIDERGEVVHLRPGAYPDRDELEADIERFLLSGSGA